jgi:hypothetical protein
VIPRGAGRVLAALVALALLGAGLWFGLLKPTVASVAKDAAEEAIEEPLAELAAQAGQAADDAAAARGAAEAVEPGALPATPTPDPAAGGGDESFRHRFETTVSAGNTATSEPVTAPEGTTLVITDMFLQNPQGDSGRLDIVVDGVDVFTDGLQNFRSLDQHVVTPIEVPAGETMTIRTNCVEPGPALSPGTASSCRVFVLVVGFNRPDPANDATDDSE